ncbi:MAG: DUF924 family protein [Paracoccaceae bacterium]
MSARAEAAARVVAFWFEEVGPERWFATDGSVDEACRRFAPLAEDALAGRLDGWAADPEGALARVLLLDQIPRNLYRGRAAAFAGDGRARAAAKTAIRRGDDLALAPERRTFVYMPLMHAESLQDQERCVRLVMLRLPPGAPTLPYAVEHRAAIRRFARFPNRNAALGRRDTTTERAWLDAGGRIG